MPNRLARETSPYLLQHAENPVDWYAWGPEALETAKREDRPILLSIGYAACHWCHVMAHESFEDEEIARMMNESFVNIKVDREERPDIDGIYMQAVQAMTGHGGWPMTMFLLPDGSPFFIPAGPGVRCRRIREETRRRRPERGAAEADLPEQPRNRAKHRWPLSTTARGCVPFAYAELRPAERRIRDRSEVSTDDGARFSAQVLEAHRQFTRSGDRRDLVYEDGARRDLRSGRRRIRPLLS